MNSLFVNAGSELACDIVGDFFANEIVRIFGLAVLRTSVVAGIFDKFYFVADGKDWLFAVRAMNGQCACVCQDHGKSYSALIFAILLYYIDYVVKFVDNGFARNQDVFGDSSVLKNDTSVVAATNKHEVVDGNGKLIILLVFAGICREHPCG